jgi:hypothetical protein
MLALGKSLGLDPVSAARLDALAPPTSTAEDEVAAYVKRRRSAGEPPATFKPGSTVLDMIRHDAS